MSDEVIDTPDAEVNASQTETTVETTPEVANEQTIGDMVGETQPKAEELDYTKAFFSEKKARKAAERELKALRESIERGASQEEISDDIAEISDEFDISPEFLQKLASSIKTQTERDLDAKYASKLGEKESKEKFDDVFGKAFDSALERGPEFKNIANTDVIKTLAKLPQNSHKTVLQLLEETYGNALTGKRTIETTTPGGGKDPEPLDLKRAGVDIEYYNQVMADSKKKAQYNAHMLSQG